MNIEEARKYLNQAEIRVKMQKEELHEVLNQQAKLYAKQKHIEESLKSNKTDIDHWTNVVSLMKIKSEYC